MEVEGLGGGHDFKLYPGGGRAWDWSETATHHVPGIQIADLQELLDHGSRVLVLSRGMQLALQTCPNALQYLREKETPVHIEETKAAVADAAPLLPESEPVACASIARKLPARD
jgi:hypothetical protein